MRKKLAALTAALALAVGPAGIAGASEESESPDSPTDIQKLSPYVEPSIVSVHTAWTGKVYDKKFGYYLRDAPFETGANCTGFVISEDGYVGTAGHCVVTLPDTKYAIMSEAVAWAYKNQFYGNVSEDAILEHAAAHWSVDAPKAGKNNSVDRDVHVSWNANISGIDISDGLPARVMGSQKFNAGDTALLKVEAEELIPLPLVNDDLGTGTEVATVGYPGTVDDVVDVDYTPSIKTGTVSSEKTVGGGLLKVYEVDAAVSPGMSGGPTVNLDGDVVGVNSFKPSEETQAFNFIQPSSNLQELLASTGVDVIQGELGATYREGLDAYFDGDKETAVAALGEVADKLPSNKFADEYLEKAEELPDPAPEPKEDEGPNMALLIAGAAIAGLLLLGGLLFFLKRRGGKPAEPAAGGEPELVAGEVVENRHCTSCGKPAAPNERFCSGCGQPL